MDISRRYVAGEVKADLADCHHFRLAGEFGQLQKVLIVEGDCVVWMKPNGGKDSGILARQLDGGPATVEVYANAYEGLYSGLKRALDHDVTVGVEVPRANMGV